MCVCVCVGGGGEGGVALTSSSDVLIVLLSPKTPDHLFLCVFLLPRAKPDEDRYMNEKATYRAPTSQGGSKRKRNRTGYNVFFSQYVYRLKNNCDGGVVPPERGSIARIVGDAWKKTSAVEKDRYEREASGIYDPSDYHAGGEEEGGGGGRGGGYPRYLHHPPPRMEPAYERVGESPTTMAASPDGHDLGCLLSPRDHRRAHRDAADVGEPATDCEGDDDHHGGDARHHLPVDIDPNGMMPHPPYPPPPDAYGGGYGGPPPGTDPPPVIHQPGDIGYDLYAYGAPPNPYDPYGFHPPNPYAMPPPGMPPMYGHPPPPPPPPNYHLPPPHPPPYMTYDESG